ncbi:hypothetical protein F5B20DRAFT_9808 [Whalleya microplaca]|nr:hypothetical protein F5B20DRAFT_9808 [Whalleya microplaca]
MRFHTSAGVAALALGSVATCERKDWSGSLASRAKAMVGVPVPPSKRQILLGNGGISVGGSGLSLGSAGAITNSTGSALQDIIDFRNNGKVAVEDNSDDSASEAGDADSVASDTDDANSVASDTDDAASDADSDAGDDTGAVLDVKEATGKAGGQRNATGEAVQADAGEIAAVKESEQFADNSGITTDAGGNAVNLGGDLGITKGKDGSVSVGGDAGINIAA